MKRKFIIRNIIILVILIGVITGVSYYFIDQNAKKYEVFVENWIPFRRINASLPEPIFNEERFLRYTQYYETQDSVYNYYLAIHDHMLSGNTAPLNYVEERIKAILLNKKRGEFIQRLEQDLYEEALRDKIVNFH